MTSRAQSTAESVTNEKVLVIFHSGLSLDGCHQVLKKHGAALEKHFELLSSERGRQMGVACSKSRTSFQLLAALQNDPSINHAEPDSLRHPLGVRPNDPRLADLWGLQRIQAVEAWALGKTADPAVIAVIDTGVSIHHPDLAPVLWRNSREIANNRLDDDRNGYVDDYFSYDFVYRKGDPDPTGDHGTHVAGIAAGAVNNALGIAGVARGASIMGLKISDDAEGMSTSAAIEAIQYVIAMKRRGVNVAVINASYGGETFSRLEQEAILAAGNAGIIVTAAAGNDTNSLEVTATYPASYRSSNMIVVAASDQNDNLADFSNYGAKSVDLVAPGVQVLSTVVGLTGWVAQANSVITGIPAAYSGKSTSTTGTIYDCGLGNPDDFPRTVRGNIALISRGTLTVAEKVSNASAAGARAAIIYNNTSGEFRGTLGDPDNWIPTIGVGQSDGLLLKDLAPINGQVSVVSDHERYGYFSGTSMASPHVAGAIAFAAMQYPAETMGQRIRRVLNSVDKTPALSAKTITGGRLNLKKMIDTDGDNLPDWWETDCFGSLTMATGEGDTDQDGLPNAGEFVADTHPNNKQSTLQLTQIRATGNKVEVRWVGGSAARQFLQRALFPQGPWRDIFTNEPPTAPESITIDELNLQGFYRLRAERP